MGKVSGFIKTFWAGIVGAVAFVGSVATILEYLKIDPATATDAASRIFWMCAPAISFACGCVSGWGFTKQWSDHRLKAAVEEHEKEVSKIRSELNAEISGLKDAIDVLEHGGFTDGRIATLLDVLPGMPREQRLVIGRAVSEGGVFISNAKTEPIARSLVKDGYLREESRGSDTCASYSVPAPLAKSIVNDEKVVESLDDATVVFNESWVRRNP